MADAPVVPLSDVGLPTASPPVLAPVPQPTGAVDLLGLPIAAPPPAQATPPPPQEES